MSAARRCGELAAFGFGENLEVRSLLSGCIRALLWIVAHRFSFVALLV